MILSVQMLKFTRVTMVDATPFGSLEVTKVQRAQEENIQITLVDHVGPSASHRSNPREGTAFAWDEVPENVTMSRITVDD